MSAFTKVTALIVASGCGRVHFSVTPEDANELATDLQFWFALDESSGSIAADSSGHGNDGKLFNPAHMTWEPTGGMLGGALHFDGTPTSSFVVFPSTTNVCPIVPTLTGSLTVSLWVEFDSFQDWNHHSLGDVAVMQGPAGGVGGGWGLGATNACGTETIGFTLSPGVSSYVVTCGTTVLTTGSWYYVTGVFDADAETAQVYLDGVNDTSGVAPTAFAISSSTNQPTMCPYLGAAANQFQLLTGTLDDVRIYTRALSAAEVLALYHVAGG